MVMIIVCPHHAVGRLTAEYGASRVIGLLGPEFDHPVIAGLPAEHHLKITVNDISEPMDGMIVPGRAHVERIIDFVEDWDAARPLIVHCWAGISRSTATAFAAMCLLNPQEDERDLAFELRAISPVATPNRRIVAHADDILGRNGRMVEAIDAIGRGTSALEGNIFEWQVRR
jgi:predicted protein tyrosine phosphatase